MYTQEITVNNEVGLHQFSDCYFTCFFTFRQRRFSQTFELKCGTPPNNTGRIPKSDPPSEKAWFALFIIFRQSGKRDQSAQSAGSAEHLPYVRTPPRRFSRKYKRNFA